MAQIKSIQLLRALAAISVTYDHVWHEAVKFEGAGAAGISTFEVPASGAGVDVFFVISGFLMVYTSRDLFGSARNIPAFLVRRILRVAPLYWLLTAIFVGCGGILAAAPLVDGLGWAGPNTSEIVKSLLFIPYVAEPSGLIQPVLKLGWTLNAEMFFYLIFALTLGLTRNAAVWSLCAAFIGLYAAGAIVSPAPGALQFWSDPLLLEFALGALAGKLFLDGVRAGMPVVLGLTVTGLAALALATRSGFDIYGPCRLLLAGIPATIFVAAAVLGPNGARGGIIVMTFVAIGDASYSLYLIHPAVMRAVTILWIWTPLHDRLPLWIYLAVTMAACIPAALLIHKRIERPLMSFLMRWAMPRHAAAMPRAASEIGVAEMR